MVKIPLNSGIQHLTSCQVHTNNPYTLGPAIALPAAACGMNAQPLIQPKASNRCWPSTANRFPLHPHLGCVLAAEAAPFGAHAPHAARAARRTRLILLAFYLLAGSTKAARTINKASSFFYFNILSAYGGLQSQATACTSAKVSFGRILYFFVAEFITIGTIAYGFRSCRLCWCFND
jgi:hypothetical protein